MHSLFHMYYKYGAQAKDIVHLKQSVGKNMNTVAFFFFYEQQPLHRYPCGPHSCYSKSNFMEVSFSCLILPCVCNLYYFQDTTTLFPVHFCFIYQALLANKRHSGTHAVLYYFGDTISVPYLAATKYA